MRRHAGAPRPAGPAGRARALPAAAEANLRSNVDQGLAGVRATNLCGRLARQALGRVGDPYAKSLGFSSRPRRSPAGARGEGGRPAQAPPAPRKPSLLQQGRAPTTPTSLSAALSGDGRRARGGGAPGHSASGGPSPAGPGPAHAALTSPAKQQPAARDNTDPAAKKGGRVPGGQAWPRPQGAAQHGRSGSGSGPGAPPGPPPHRPAHGALQGRAASSSAAGSRPCWQQSCC